METIKNLTPRIRQALQEYIKDPSKNQEINGPLGLLLFYTYLLNNKPALLEFRCSGDKYQKLKSICFGIYHGT
jgi:hypothetical protein